MITIGKEWLVRKNSMPVNFGMLMSKKIRFIDCASRIVCAFKGLSASPLNSKKEMSSMYSFNNFLATGSSSTIIHFNFMAPVLILLRKSYRRNLLLIHAFADIKAQASFLHLLCLFPCDHPFYAR